MNARSATQVDVYKGEQLAGTLMRSEHGAVFSYAPSYLAVPPAQGHADIAFAMPVRSEPYEVFGVNLHPFFAGLLPEGLRLRALTRALKTSDDDLFSLLVASGADTVGDVSVAESGALPKEHAPVADTKHLAQLSFQRLFEESLQYEAGRGDLSIAGVQPKISAAMISFPLRTKDARRAYILKLTPPDYPRLVENEAFFMGVAKALGIPVAKTQIVHDRDGASALLVERFDRTPGQGGYTRIHQEDACQLLGRYPADKYRLTLSDVANALEVCSAPLAERLKLLRLQAFSYLIVNGDMHAKNVSVRVVGSLVELTPAYDLLSTLPYADRSLALAMEGRDDYVRRAHFVAFGERAGLRGQAVELMLDALCKRLAPWIERLPEIGLATNKTEHLARTMRQRLEDLAG